MGASWRQTFGRLQVKPVPIAFTPRRLRSLLPRLGARTLKTALAIMLSIATARSLHLPMPQFAGVVAVLAVQPSIHRSLRQGIRQWCSAIIGATAALLWLTLFGRSAWAIGLAALFVMGWHVRWRWTPSLLVAVVICINTMGASGPYLAGAIHQLQLVGIGMGWGTALNLVFRPSHRRTAQRLREGCEKALAVLWRDLARDVDRGRLMPYAKFRMRLEDLHARVDEARRFATYLDEDLHHLGRPASGLMPALRAMESAIERTRDIHRALERLQGCCMDPVLYRTWRVVCRSIQSLGVGRSGHPVCLRSILDKVERLWLGPLTQPDIAAAFPVRATEYQLFRHLCELCDALSTYTDARHGQEIAGRQRIRTLRDPGRTQGARHAQA